MEVFLSIAAIVALFFVFGRKSKSQPKTEGPSPSHKPPLPEEPLINRLTPPRPAPHTKREVTAPAPPTPQTLKGKCWVIDGDTIVINKMHIRLFGMDAPEIEDPFGRNAKFALMKLCKGQTISVELTGYATFERSVGKCFLPDGRDLSAEMVKMGHAVDWPKFSGGIYSHLEVEGIRKKLWRCDALQKGRLASRIPD